MLILIGTAAIWCGATTMARAHRILKYANIGRPSDWLDLAAGALSVFAGCYAVLQGIA